MQDESLEPVFYPILKIIDYTPIFRLIDYIIIYNNWMRA